MPGNPLARFQRNDSDVLRRQALIRNAAGFDGHNAQRAIHLRNIAPRERRQVVAVQFHIGLINLFSQFQHAFHSSMKLL